MADEPAVKSLTIHIVVDQGKEIITVTDDAGNKRTLQSVMVVGGDFTHQEFYLFGAGASADLGWALANAWKYSRMSKRPQDGLYSAVFDQFLTWIATYFGWLKNGKEVDGEELLKRWVAEDEEAAREAMKRTKFWH